jgi:hypothetical protein
MIESIMMDNKNKDMRIQFEISNNRLKELEALMDAAGVNTKKELLNNALTLLEWAIEEERKGRIIASLDEQTKKYRELVMPIFRSARQLAGGKV